MTLHYTVGGKKKKTPVTSQYTQSFPGGSADKQSACNAGNLGSIPGFERSPGEGNGNPLHYFTWRIPWTEKPGRLQSTRSQRVGHN